MTDFSEENKRLEEKTRTLIQQHEIELRNLKEFYMNKTKDAYDAGYEKGYDKGFDKGYDSGYSSGYRDGQREERW